MALYALRTNMKKNELNLTISEGTQLRSFFSESKFEASEFDLRNKINFNTELIELVMLKHDNTLHNYIVYCYMLKISTDIKRKGAF